MTERRAPWHMWGNSVQLRSDTGVAGGNTAASQLLRINYKRPETWSFFFAAELLNAATPAPNMNVVVLIDLIAGVGRSNFDTFQQGNILTVPAFVRFDFLFTPPFGPGPFRKYTTRGSGPLVDDNIATSAPVIDWIPAQDIQVQVRARVSGPLGSLADVSVYGAFAPRSHVRPEWFTRVGQFTGGERDGT